MDESEAMLRDAEARGRESRAAADTARRQAGAASERVTALEAAVTRLCAAREAAGELQRVAQPRIVLEERIDVLRAPPPTEDEMARLRSEKERIAARCEVLTRALMALRYVIEHRAALDWSDAEEALRSEKTLVPALERQLEEARRAADAAGEALKGAEARLRETETRANETDAEVKSHEEALARDREEWERLGIEDKAEVGDDQLAIAESRVEETQVTVLAGGWFVMSRTCLR